MFVPWNWDLSIGLFQQLFGEQFLENIHPMWVYSTSMSKYYCFPSSQHVACKVYAWISSYFLLFSEICIWELIITVQPVSSSPSDGNSVTATAGFKSSKFTTSFSAPIGAVVFVILSKIWLPRCLVIQENLEGRSRCWLLKGFLPSVKPREGTLRRRFRMVILRVEVHEPL